MMQTVVLIVVSLLSVFALQVYYGWQVYQQQTSVLRETLTGCLGKAVEVAQKARLEELSGFFAQDLSRTDHVLLGYATEEDGTHLIYVIDAITHLRHTSTPFPWTGEGLPTRVDMEDHIIARNQAILEEGSVFYWTEWLGERLVRYQDSLVMTAEMLEAPLRLVLADRGLPIEFTLLVGGDSIATPPTSFGSLWSQSILFDPWQESVVAVALTNPGYTVLRRMGTIVVFTVLVLLLIVISFRVLYRLFNDQRRLSDLKDDFIDNVTHELITPLSALQLALESLGKDSAVAVDNKYFVLSKQQTKRIGEVVDQVLKATFVEQAHMVLRMERVKIKEVLEEVLNYHQTTATKQVEVSISPFDGEWVFADRQHLANVFHNLVSNGIKYSEGDRVMLTVEVESGDDALLVRLTDTGNGVPIAQQELIFDKFHRAQSSETHDVKGLGIGLYYARGIMRRMEGELRLVSSSSRGSTFEVIIPRAN